MSTSPQRADTSQQLPPIVLLIGADGRAEQYTAALESEGLWVSTVRDATDAFSIARELRPDIVVADYSTGAVGSGNIVHVLKHHAQTYRIPVIVLGDTPAAAEADLCIMPAAAPAVLAHHVRDLVRSSQESPAAVQQPVASAPVSEFGGETNAAREASTQARLCPKCAVALDWIER